MTKPIRLLAALLFCGCASTPKPTPPPAPEPATHEPAHAAVPPPLAPGAITDRSLGLSKTSVFEVPDPLKWAFVKESPGGNDRLPRAYPGAPPRIPHDVAGYLPITVARNGCLKCHDIAKAATEDDPTPIPASHHVDLRNAPGVHQKEIAGARWVCTSCHVPQAQVPPPVGNDFQPVGG